MAAEPRPTLVDVENAPTLDEFLARRAGHTRGIVSRVYSAIAEPVTKAVTSAIEPAVYGMTQPLVSAARFGMGEPAGQILSNPEPRVSNAIQNAQGPARSLAEMAVPQTPTDLAIMAGTLGAGGIATKAGLTGLKASATRIGGGTIGGTVGGAAESESPTGAAWGAVKGLASSTLGEALGGAMNFARNVGIDRMRKKIQGIDAERVGHALEQNPKLGDVFAGMRTPEQLRELALGTTTLPSGKVANVGIAKLQAAQEAANTEIGQLISQRPPPPNIGQGVTAPQYFARQSGFFPDPQNPSRFVPWDEAKQSLSELGIKAFGGPKGNPLEPTINGVDTKQAWAEAVRELKRYLGNYDPTGKALALFNGAQEQYEAGRYALKTLRAAFQRLEPDRVAFNSDRIQRLLGTQETQATKKLGPEGFDALAQAVRLKQGAGYQDLFSPSGILSRMAEILPGPGGTYARLRVGEPSLVGNPFTATQPQRTGLTLTTQAVGLPLANQVGLPLTNPQ